MYKKKNILVVFAELMKLMNTEKNLKQFVSMKYPEAFIQLTHYISTLPLERTLLHEFERAFKVWVEIYFSKFTQVEYLISNLDYFAAAINDEFLGH